MCEVIDITSRLKITVDKDKETTDKEYSERLNRVRVSLRRIDKLMAELKELSRDNGHSES